MALILDTKDVKATFLKRWNLSFVPAVIEYMRNSRKFLSLLSNMEEAGQK